MDKDKTNKKRPGPKPEMISLFPFTFDEVLDAALESKPKKAKKECGNKPEKEDKTA